MVAQYDLNRHILCDARCTEKAVALARIGLTYQKRFPDIVQAFARVRRDRPTAVLQIVGEGSNRLEYEEFARRELPPGSFHFHGFLPKPRLAELMRQASGFVLPSEAENLPNVLIEAIACGCPVLTTRVGGITALVGEDEGILVDVGNIDQISDGMYRLLDGTHGFDMDRKSREVERSIAMRRLAVSSTKNLPRSGDQALGPRPV